MACALVALSKPECPVCLNLFELPPSTSVPKMLPCGHSVCGECLAQMVRANGGCPMRCAGLPTADAPTNFALLEALSPDAAVGRLPRCSAHLSKRLDMYCFSCSAAVCERCVMLDHPVPTHTVTDLRVAAEEGAGHHASLRSRATEEEKVLASKVARLERGETVLHEAKSRLESHRDAALQAAHSAFDAWVDTLQRRRKAVVAAIKAMADSDKDVLDDQVDNLLEELAATRTVRDKLVRLLKSESPMALVEAGELRKAGALGAWNPVGAFVDVPRAGGEIRFRPGPAAKLLETAMGMCGRAYQLPAGAFSVSLDAYSLTTGKVNVRHQVAGVEGACLDVAVLNDDDASAGDALDVANVTSFQLKDASLALPFAWRTFAARVRVGDTCGGWTWFASATHALQLLSSGRAAGMDNLQVYSSAPRFPDMARLIHWRAVTKMSVYQPAQEQFQERLIQQYPGFAELVEELKANSTLQELCVSRVPLNDTDAAALADALRVNTTLTGLTLSYNKIGDAGFVAVAEALKVNTTLRGVNCSLSCIGDAGCAALADALKTNAALKLTLWGLHGSKRALLADAIADERVRVKLDM